MTSNATAGYHFTVKADLFNENQLIELLSENCKKWVFQKEVGEETGLPHFQGQISLKKKLRFQTLKKNNWMSGAHWSITHAVEDWSYAQKEDTRVDGPWTSENNTPIVLTRPSAAFEEMEKYPWQEKLIEMVESYDERCVDVIYDPTGCNGKSTVVKYLGEKKKVLQVPPVNDSAVIMQFAFAFPNKKAYLMDMPRAMNKKKLADMYSALESLKNGYCYETRYEAKFMYMDPPRVVVFCNTLPNFDYLSADRWRVWMIDSRMDLVQVDRGGL